MFAHFIPGVQAWLENITYQMCNMVSVFSYVLNKIMCSDKYPNVLSLTNSKLENSLGSHSSTWILSVFTDCAYLFADKLLSWKVTLRLVVKTQRAMQFKFLVDVELRKLGWANSLNMSVFLSFSLSVGKTTLTWLHSIIVPSLLTRCLVEPKTFLLISEFVKHWGQCQKM